jgi:hypothetical protein
MPEANLTKRAALYCLVSTMSQTCESQRQELLEVAARSGCKSSRSMPIMPSAASRAVETAGAGPNAERRGPTEIRSGRGHGD